jgi:hypothetical protein
VIFVDTSFFFPLLSAHDRDHNRLGGRFKTGNFRQRPETSEFYFDACS